MDDLVFYLEQNPRKREPNEFHEKFEFGAVIHAVGVNVESAINALAKSIGLKDIDGITFFRAGNPRRWWVGFNAVDEDGSVKSFDANGWYVAGGVFIVGYRKLQTS